MDESDDGNGKSIFEDYMTTNPFINPSDDKIFTFKEEEK
jgi:hypothetical protein